ncbi:MAG TPA: lysine--tRNA ligase, partial [Chromatiales bacterium]|nr:lysine--tRNA ligase [Chromatiales bacterium]
MRGLPHWVDELASRVEEFLRTRGKNVYVFNGGLSVSGLQHLGRLRGEVLIGEAVRRILERKGYKIKQYVTLYTQDPWKGKERQLEQFPDPRKAARYAGWPLIKVPDPKGCHSSWVEHFWEDFGGFLDSFTDGKIEVVTTTELYKGALKEVVKEMLRKRELARIVVNKYRGRRPYPEGWIPVEAVCGRCGRIDSTEALRLMGDDEVEYVCRSCGYRGVARIEDGKVNWRLEWPGVWKALGVDFEPYGKDHAAPGGSRDSCVEISRKVLGYEPPMGVPYEWVAVRFDGGEADMSSSDFIGVTPREWLEVANAEVLRFLYFQTPPMRKVVISLREVPSYYERFYQAERVYYGVDEAPKGEDEEVLKRSYELSLLREAGSVMPVQVPYTHMALMSQVLPRDKRLEEALRRLRSSGHLKRPPSEQDVERISSLIEKSLNWVRKYAPPAYRIKVLESVTEDLKSKIAMRDQLRELASVLRALDEWNEGSIK